MPYAEIKAGYAVVLLFGMLKDFGPTISSIVGPNLVPETVSSKKSCYFFGVTRYRPPVLESSSIHSAPSGPTSTVADPMTDIPALGRLGASLPSKVMRSKVLLPIPPMRADPFHCGNITPL